MLLILHTIKATIVLQIRIHGLKLAQTPLNLLRNYCNTDLLDLSSVLVP